MASPTQGSAAHVALLRLFNDNYSGEDDAQLGACASVSLMTEKVWTVFDELLCADSKWHRDKSVRFSRGSGKVSQIHAATSAHAV